MYPAKPGVYKNMSRGVVALVFRCKPTGGRLTVNEEVSAFRWAAPDEVAAVVNEAFAIRIADALADLRSPAVRQHDGTRLIQGLFRCLGPLDARYIDPA